MNMKSLYKSLLTIVVVAGLFSCNGYLEKQPRALLTPDKVIGDSVGIQSVLASAYRRMHQFEYYGRDMMLLGDVLADNARIARNTGRYVTHINNQIFSHFNLWSNAPYAAINDANYVLEGANDPKVIMSDNLRKRFKAEALFLRALCHHDLLRVYSYEPANAGSFNLGVVIRNKPTKGASDTEGAVRATVQEGYDFVIADLEEAISLFSTIPNVSFPTRANLAAAQALLARVYLYKGDFAKAADLADEALNTVDNQAAPKATLTTAANHRTAFATTIHPESMFELDIAAADWNTTDGLNNSLASWTRNPNNTYGGASVAGAFYAIAASNSLNSAFPAGDVRRFGAQSVWTPDADGLIECGKWRGEKNSFLENVPVIRYSELILIQAEGRARSGNEPAALAALNRLRNARGLGNITLSGAALINEVMLQRRLELAFEGHRFFDLKRLGLPIAKDPAQGPALTPSDIRILSFIPATEITLNPKLVQNPGY